MSLWSTGSTRYAESVSQGPSVTAGRDESWCVLRRLRITRHQRLIDGLPQFGFHTNLGLVVVEFHADWIGLVTQGTVAWTAGDADPGLSPTHVPFVFDKPRFAAAASPRELLVCDAHRVYRIDTIALTITTLIDTSAFGVQELGNCVPSPAGHLWVNDIVGHQILEFSGDGRLLETVGNGTAGFHPGSTAYDDARFGWIYDLRCGPDGRLYVLDSTNYAVRVIDPESRTVTTICGDGQPGRSGDGGPATSARLGGDSAADFDGPWSLIVDTRGDVYIGDTHNHAVRRIGATAGIITTIADATSLMPPIEGAVDSLDDVPPAAPFTKICGMDLNPRTGHLLVPDWIDDTTDELLVLARVN